MKSSNPPLHVFVEVVGLDLVGICIDKLGNEDFYGFVGIHVGHLLGCMKFLLDLGFEVFKSMNTYLGVRNPLNFPSCVYVWVMNHLGVVFHDAFGLFWVFGWIFGKRDEINKSGQFRGPTPWRRDPMQRHG